MATLDKHLGRSDGNQTSAIQGFDGRGAGRRGALTVLGERRRWPGSTRWFRGVALAVAIFPERGAPQTGDEPGPGGPDTGGRPAAQTVAIFVPLLSWISSPPLLLPSLFAFDLTSHPPSLSAAA